jgi:hypothetical protein
MRDETLKRKMLGFAEHVVKNPCSVGLDPFETSAE